MIGTKLLARLLLFCTGVLCPACGSKGLAEAKGNVTLDGEPVAGASVTFFPVAEAEGAEAGNARTDEDGDFSLATRGAVGVQPGRYKVIVAKQEVLVVKGEKAEKGPGKARMNALAKAKNVLPQIYSAVNTTPLEIEVPAGGSKDLKLELTSSAK